MWRHPSCLVLAWPGPWQAGARPLSAWAGSPTGFHTSSVLHPQPTQPGSMSMPPAHSWGSTTPHPVPPLASCCRLQVCPITHLCPPRAGAPVSQGPAAPAQSLMRTRQTSHQGALSERTDSCSLKRAESQRKDCAALFSSCQNKPLKSRPRRGRQRGCPVSRHAQHTHPPAGADSPTWGL